MVSARDISFMREFAPFKYGVASYISGSIGSSLVSYKGKLYEALGFLAGGIAAAGTAYLRDRCHGFNQQFITDAIVQQVFFHTISTFVGTVIGVIGPLFGNTNITNDRVFTFLNAASFYMISYVSYIGYKIFRNS